MRRVTFLSFFTLSVPCGGVYCGPTAGPSFLPQPTAAIDAAPSLPQELSKMAAAIKMAATQRLSLQLAQELSMVATPFLSRLTLVMSNYPWWRHFFFLPQPHHCIKCPQELSTMAGPPLQPPRAFPKRWCHRKCCLKLGKTSHPNPWA